MTNTKQKAREMFDEKFTIEGNRWRFFERNSPEPVQDFLDTIIDMAVKERNQELLSKLPNGYGDRKSGMAIGYDHAIADFKHLLTK